MGKDRSTSVDVLAGVVGSLCSNAGGNVVAESVRNGTKLFVDTAAVSGVAGGITAVLACCTPAAIAPVLGYAAILAGSHLWEARKDAANERASREHFAQLKGLMEEILACQGDQASLAAERVEAIHKRQSAVWAFIDGADKRDIADKAATAVLAGLRKPLMELVREVQAANAPDLAKWNRDDFDQFVREIGHLGFSIHFEVKSLRSQVQQGFEDAKERSREDHKELLAAIGKVQASIDAPKQAGVDPTRAVPTPDVVEAARIVQAHAEDLFDRAQASLAARDFARWQEQLSELRSRPSVDEVFRIKMLEGDGYYAQGKFDEAIAPYEVAAGLRPDHLTARNNLAIALTHARRGDRTHALRRAIALYEQTLASCGLERSDWAMTQNNLGNAWSDLPTGDRAENIQRAIACYGEALKEYTRAAAPMEWAKTQNNLGAAWRNLPTGDRAENIQRAIACYGEALKERTRAAAPMEWAMTQYNLGNAWSDLPTGERAENIQRAIACYGEALKEYTRAAAPMEWATTQNNLAIAYSDLAEQAGQDPCGLLRRTIASGKGALGVFTREVVPREHASATKNLAIHRRRYEELGCDDGPGGVAFEDIPAAE
jgi:tetratricopeptide (TPR) repeat protein